MDADDRPEQEIKITGASVFVNPYKEMEEEEQRQAEAERRKASQQGEGSWMTARCILPADLGDLYVVVNAGKTKRDGSNAESMQDC